MSYLKKTNQLKVEITLQLQLNANKVEPVKKALENIVSNCNQDDIILLGKLANNNIKRPIAIAALRREFN